MHTVFYITKMLGLVLFTCIKRLIGQKKYSTWPLKTELIWATTRLTLLSSKHYGLPWLKKLSSQYRPSKPNTSQLTIETIQSPVGTYLKTVPKTAQTNNSPIIIYFHGGGYVTGSPHTCSEFTRQLAVLSHSTVITPFYPTAPEAPYPAAHKAAQDFVSYLIKTQPQQPIIVAGDSAGGALSLSVLQNLSPKQQSSIIGCLLISPWIDPLAQEGSIQSNAQNDVGDRAFVVSCYHSYLQNANPLSQHPLKFSSNNIPTFLPPVFISIGSAEILLDQVLLLAQQIQDQQIATQLMIYKNMFHTFWNMPKQLQEAKLLTEDIAQWIAQLQSNKN